MASSPTFPPKPPSLLAFEKLLAGLQSEVSARKSSHESRRIQSSNARKACSNLIMHNMVFSSTLSDLTYTIQSQLGSKIQGLQFAQLFIISHAQNPSKSAQHTHHLPDPAQNRPALSAVQSDQSVYYFDLKTRGKRPVNVAEDRLLSYVACWHQSVVLPSEKTPSRAGALACLPIFSPSSPPSSKSKREICGMLKVGKGAFSGDFRSEEVEALETLCSKCYGISVVSCLEQEEREACMLALQQELRELRVKASVATKTCGLIQAELNEKVKGITHVRNQLAQAQAQLHRASVKAKIVKELSISRTENGEGLKLRLRLKELLMNYLALESVRIQTRMVPHQVDVREVKMTSDNPFASRFGLGLDLSLDLDMGLDLEEKERTGMWWESGEGGEGGMVGYGEGYGYGRTSAQVEVDTSEVVQEGGYTVLVVLVKVHMNRGGGGGRKHEVCTSRIHMMRKTPVDKGTPGAFADASEVAFITDLCQSAVPLVVTKANELRTLRVVAVEHRMLDLIRSKWKRLLQDLSLSSKSSHDWLVSELITATLAYEDLIVKKVEGEAEKVKGRGYIHIGSTVYCVGRRDAQPLPVLATEALCGVGRVGIFISVLADAWTLLCSRELANLHLREQATLRKEILSHFLKLASSGSCEEASRCVTDLSDLLGIHPTTLPTSLIDLLQSSATLEDAFATFKTDLDVKSAELRRLSADATYQDEAMAELLMSGEREDNHDDGEARTRRVLQRFTDALLPRVDASTCWVLRKQAYDAVKVWSAEGSVLVRADMPDHTWGSMLVTPRDHRVSAELLQALGIRTAESLLLVPVVLEGGSRPVVVGLTGFDRELFESGSAENEWVDRTTQVIHSLASPLLCALGFAAEKEEAVVDLMDRLRRVVEAASSVKNLQAIVSSLDMNGCTWRLVEAEAESADDVDAEYIYNIGDRDRYVLAVGVRTAQDGTTRNSYAQATLDVLARTVAEVVNVQVKLLETAAALQHARAAETSALEREEAVRMELESTAVDHKTTVESLQKQLFAVEKQLKKAQRSLKRCERDRSSSVSREEKALAEVAALENTKNQLASDLDLRQHQIDAGRRDIEALKNVVSRLSSRMEERRSVESKQEQTRQHDEVESLTKTQAQLALSRQENTELCRELDEGNKQTLALRETLKQAERKHEACLNKARNELRKRETAEANLLHRIAEFEQDLHGVNAVNAELQLKQRRLDRTVEKLEGELSSEQKRRKAAKEEICRLDGEEKKRAAVLELKETECMRLGSVVEEMRQTAAAWKAKFEQMEQECFRYERERVLLVCKKRADKEERERLHARGKEKSSSRRRRSRT